MKQTSRRHFLKTSMAAGVGLVASRSTFAASAARTIGANEAVRVAVIGMGGTETVGGVGGRGHQLIASLLQVPDVRIAALCDVDQSFLRREAQPLYALLAEALVLPEAACATITRKGVAPIVVDIKDANLSATLVMPGDTVKVSGTPPAPVVTDFYFVGGEINSPGQKPYHSGITLTQGILASGGMKASGGSKVRVSRQASDGRLITEEFNLRKIQTGKYPDPILQKGDRVEVMSSN